MRYLLVLAFAMLATLTVAAPARYELDPDRSKVEFIYDLDGSAVKGTIPIIAADVVLDPAQMNRSSVSVEFDTTRTKGGLIFDTETLRGPAILDAANHPLARFETTSISGTPAKSSVTGRLTQRGITRPITLSAKVLRQAGTDPTDISKLVIRISGTFQRADFGMITMPNLVGPTIKLNTIVYLNRAE